MRLLFSSLISFVLCTSSPAQTFEWVGNMGGETQPVQSEGGLAADLNGNAYITGHFALGTVDIDPGPGVHELTANNGDAFVAKVGPDGNLIWAAHLTGNFFIWGVDVAATPDGGVVAVGHFNGTVDFDPGAGTNDITAAGDDDIFILKLSASGAFQWVKTFATVSDYSQPRCHSVSVDPMGNIAVSGRYNGDMTVATAMGNITLSSINGEHDYFLMHLSSSGTVNWAKSIGTSQWEAGDTNPRTDVAMGSDGSVFMIGELRGTIDFNPGGPNGVVSPSADISIFIVRFNANGSLNWVKKIGGDETAGWTEMPHMGSVAVGPDDKVYFASRLSGEAELADSLTIGTPFFNRSFVAQYDLEGNAQWARMMDADLSQIAVDAAGYLYCTGYTGNNANMDIGHSNTTASTSNSMNFVMPYLMRFDAEGEFDNLIVYDAPNAATAQNGYGVACGGGSVFTSGQLRSVTVFSPDDPNGTATPNNTNGQTETYLARHFSPIPECVSATQPVLSVVGNTTVCLGDVVTFNLTGDLNDNLNWSWTTGSDCEGTALGTGTSVSATMTQVGSLTFSAHGVRGGCQAGPCGSVSLTVELCDNIDELGSEISKMTFMREAGVLRVANTDLAGLTVFDISGRQLLTADALIGTKEISLAHLPSGLYIAVLNSGNRSKETLRFVK